MTEPAVQGAAHLARDAQRAPVFLGDMDALDLVAVTQAQQPFVGAVHRGEIARDVGTGNDEALGQLRAQCLRDVGHHVKIGDAATVDPLEELVGAEARLVHFSKDRNKVVAIHADQVDQAIGLQRGRREKVGVQWHGDQISRTSGKRNTSLTWIKGKIVPGGENVLRSNREF